MNPRMQKLAIEIKQTNSILNDFSKSVKKCNTLSKELGEQIPSQNFKYFEDLQMEARNKISVIDLPGLVNLKIRLANSLSELLDIQHQLDFKAQRRKARRQHLQNSFINQENYRQQKNEVEERRQRERKENEKNAKKEDPKKTKLLQQQLPFFNPKNDNAENKIDYINKYIAAMKKNIKHQTKSSDYTFKTKQYLMMEPEYLKIRRQLQIYKMRQEELTQIFDRKVQEQVERYLQNCEVVEETKNYKVLKVIRQGKKSVETENISKEESKGSSEGSEQNVKILQQMGAQMQDCEDSKVDINEVKRRVEQDFEEIRKRLEQTGGDNLEGIFQKINQTVEVSEQKLKELRGKRKKMFIDDDIWDEMQKM